MISYAQLPALDPFEPQPNYWTLFFSRASGCKKKEGLGMRLRVTTLLLHGKNKASTEKQIKQAHRLSLYLFCRPPLCRDLCVSAIISNVSRKCLIMRE